MFGLFLLYLLPKSDLTKRMKKLLYFIAPIILASACGSQGVTERLNEIDTLIDKEQIDSACVILHELDNVSMTAEDFYEKRRQISESYDVSTRTLQRYVDAYRDNGIDGLKPKGRVPSQNPIISEELLAQAIQLRREVPSRSIPTIIQILELEGKAAPGMLKRTTLQRALAKAGYSAEMMKTYRDKGYASQRFARVHRNDLWQGDIKYGPILKISGKAVQTYMSCLIDDATRYIIHAEFYGNMEQAIVEDTLKSNLRHGSRNVITAGRTARSEQLRNMLSRETPCRCAIRTRRILRTLFFTARRARSTSPAA